MVQWKRISTGIRPVPSPAATTSVWATAGVAAVALVAVLNLLDGPDDPTVGLLAPSLAVAG
ncbi:hypothetical protein AB8B25_19430, partial [Streptomyces sp. BF23-30]